MRHAVLALLATVALGAAQAPRYVVPNSPDLTITTRTIRSGPAGGGFTIRRTLKLKGARQATDTVFGDRPGRLVVTTIGQCDRRRTLILNHDDKLYAFQPLRDLPRLEHRAGRTGAAPENSEHPLQTMTIDAVDTGERRQFGTLTARHVISTTTTEDGRARPARSKSEVRDGWYVDLPPVGCIDWGGSRAKQGFPLIETLRSVGPEPTLTITTELLEVSADPIDPAVFDVPAGYLSALPRWDGSYDMTRPDTLVNRAALLWQDVRRLAAKYWR